jgi:hypothetical protein
MWPRLCCRYSVLRYLIAFAFTLTLMKQTLNINGSFNTNPEIDASQLRDDYLLNITLTDDRQSIEFYRQYLKLKNGAQPMFNTDLFATDANIHYVLLVQVHDRASYLKEFIQRLSLVSNINQTLLIFSHDVLDSQINQFVAAITFAPVSQSFRTRQR